MAAVSGPFGPRGRSAQQHGQDAFPTVVPAGVHGHIETQNPDKPLRQISLVEVVAPVLDGQLAVMAFFPTLVNQKRSRIASCYLEFTFGISFNFVK